MGISVGEEKVTKIELGDVESKKWYNNSVITYGPFNKKTFSATGAEQTWTVPATGKYKLEVWGAEGGQLNGNGNTGGKGGYACGTVTLQAGTVLKIYVGKKGGYGNGADSGGFNGGGRGGNYSYGSTNNSGGGGGASDIRIGGNTLYDRLIVAGGGGGGNAGGAETEYAYGGGESGGMSRSGNQGGTQTSAGNGASFGNGASNGGSAGNNYGWAGGGGGWYGGGSAGGTSDSWSNNFTAGGGSGFVWTGQEEVPTGYLVSEDYILSDTQNIAGNQEMPNPEGGTMTGNTGDGIVIINCPFFLPQYQKVSEPGVYHNEELGLISMSADGEHWVTIDDKNVGAISADIEDEDSYGNYFQFGNIHGFGKLITLNELCFTATEVGSSIKLDKYGTPTEVQLEYSSDGLTWNDYTIGDVIALSNVGDKVYMRNTSETPTGFSISNSKSYQFVVVGGVAASGDITYLLCKYGTDTLSNYCFTYLFYECLGLVTPPRLPATELAEGCYEGMFYGCEDLITAPELPALSVPKDGYRQMFVLSGITESPELPATVLGNFCYYGMFNGCPELKTVPELPAVNLAAHCYGGMFYNCPKIKVYATQIGAYNIPFRIPKSGTGVSATGALEDMFYGTGGTFTSDPSINTTYYLNNPNVWTFGYDFRNGSLEGFQAAGGTNIDDNGTHTFDANGIGQTSSSSDRQFTAFVPLPDISNAKTIELESTGYYINGCWSNGKGLGLCTNNNQSSWGVDLRSEITFSNNSGYQGQGIVFNGTGREITQQNLSTGDYTLKFKVDFVEKKAYLNVVGPSTVDKTTSLTDSEIASVLAMQYVNFWIGRGTYYFNGERLKTISITVSY